MKRIVHSYLIIFTLLVVNLSCLESERNSRKYLWKNITEFKFYGYNDPDLKPESQFINADLEKIKAVFSGLTPCNGYLPKGASRFAVIRFKNEKQISIQILAGSPYPFCVLHEKYSKSDWFDIQEGVSKAWSSYLEELTSELKNSIKK